MGTETEARIRTGIEVGEPGTVVDALVVSIEETVVLLWEAARNLVSRAAFGEELPIEETDDILSPLFIVSSTRSSIPDFC